MIDFKSLTDEELLDLIEKSDDSITKELAHFKNKDEDFKMRLINLTKQNIKDLKSLYFPMIEHLEKALSDDRVPENIKEELKLKLIKYKQWQKNQ